MHYYLYSICGISCLLYALFAGGAPERWAVLVMAIGSVVTPFVMADWDRGFINPEWGILTIDLLDQIALTVIALKANRFWPIPVAAIHVLPIMIHCAKIAAPGIERHVYSTTQAFESYLILAMIAIGTYGHRHRLKAHGVDKSWSTSSASQRASAARRSPMH